MKFKIRERGIYNGPFRNNLASVPIPANFTQEVSEYTCVRNISEELPTSFITTLPNYCGGLFLHDIHYITPKQLKTTLQLAYRAGYSNVVVILNKQNYDKVWKTFEKEGFKIIYETINQRTNNNIWYIMYDFNDVDNIEGEVDEV